MLEDARVRLLALEHAVLRAVDLRERLAEDLDDREEHHRARRVARIGGGLRAVLAEERAARVLGEVLEDATEHRAMLAAALRPAETWPIFCAKCQRSSVWRSSQR